MGYELLHVLAGERRRFATLGPDELHGLTLEKFLPARGGRSQDGMHYQPLRQAGRSSKRWLPERCGNQLQGLQRSSPGSSTPGTSMPTMKNRPFDLGPAQSVKLIESGPLRASYVEVKHATQKSSFAVQDIILYAGMDCRVDVANAFDWHEQHVLLKAAFPLSASSPMATPYEIPFGNIQRPTTRNNSWEDARFEVSAIRWADPGQRPARPQPCSTTPSTVMTLHDNVLRLTLLRAPTGASGMPARRPGHAPSLSMRYIPMLERGNRRSPSARGMTSTTSCKRFRWRRTRRKAAASALFRRCRRRERAFLTAIEKAEDSNALIFRFYEWAGKNSVTSCCMFLRAQPVRRADQPDGAAKEEGSNLPVDGNTIHVSAHHAMRS